MNKHVWEETHIRFPRLEFCFNETTCFDLVMVGANQGPRSVLPSPEVTVWREPWTDTLYTLLLMSHIHNFHFHSCPGSFQVDTKSPWHCQGKKSGKSAFPTSAKLKGHIPFCSNLPSWRRHTASKLHLCNEACRSQVGARNTFFCLHPNLGWLPYFWECIPQSSNHMVFYNIPKDKVYTC